MSDDKKKKKGLGGALDKLLMGAIIGGAIGSVLGMSVAPKKGKDTRHLIKNKTKELLSKGKEIIENSDSLESIKKEALEQGKKLFNFVEKRTPERKKDLSPEEMKEIPHED